MLLCGVSASAQDSTKTYPAVIHFRSECCGVPNAQPLYDYLKKFRKTYGTGRFTVDKIGPLGREGEYNLAIRFPALKASRKKLLLNKLNQITAGLPGKGKAELVEDEALNTRSGDGRATLTTRRI